MSQQSLVLKTDRLELRLPLKEEASNLLEFHQQNQAHFDPWDPPKPEGFFAEEFWKTYIEKAHTEFESNQSIRLIIIHKETNALIGSINTNSFERGPFQSCRIGYKMSKSFEGQGYMKEALRGLIQHLFAEMNFHRIEANHATHNIRSEALLKSLGFHCVGIEPNYLFINGRWMDHKLNNLKNENWKNTLET